jgi:microcompartment protein CcmK/EutM
MYLAKVIGTVVATTKDKALTGVKLLVIQPLDSSGKACGAPLVASDTIGAGYGELVFCAKSKDGAMPLPNPDAPSDAGIIGIVDYTYNGNNQR